MLLYTAGKTAFIDGIQHFRNKMLDSDRERILAEFSKPDSIIRCLVSTVAFGMGIDILDIRIVFHWGESDSVSQY